MDQDPKKYYMIALKIPDLELGPFSFLVPGSPFVAFQMFLWNPEG